MAIPNNGVEDVPETQGVPALVDWLEERYPDIHKLAEA